MALQRTLAKRLNHSGARATAELFPVIQSTNAAKSTFQRQYFSSPESTNKSFNFDFLRRILHRRALYHASGGRIPEIFSLPVGEKLREKLKSVSFPGERLRLEGLSPPAMVARDGLPGSGMSVTDARKILKVWRAEKVRTKLREIKESSISYEEYVRVCVEECESHEQGLEFARMLDETGNVIVFGNVVFVRPEQIAKSMEKLLHNSMPTPNDPRRVELEEMEKHKTLIDAKARAQVKAELYCGLGYLTVQTLGFMRLTFWELSWDVMEPICFFVTSLHFALAYAFFLRTSREPSFEGYFERRFRTKQKKLMEELNFDMERYNELRKAFYPTYNGSSSYRSEYFCPL